MKTVLISAAILALMFTSCTDSGTRQTIAEGSKTAYSLNFFQKAASSMDRDQNMIVSPFSAGSALSMLAEGAEGQTQEEILKALNGIPFKNEKLYSDKDNKVTSANSIWVKNGFPVKKDYWKLVEKDYGALVTNLDFSSPKAVKAINDWCSDNTEGLIPSIIDGIDPSYVMFLLNALYFKAPWDHFDKNATMEGTFNGSRGKNKVPFMNTSKSFPYAEYRGCQMVEIPYEGNKYSMIVAMPSKSLDINDLIKYINEEAYDAATSSMNMRKVALSLPKFKFETSINLNKALMDMGMVKAFGKGEFGAMTDASVCVDEVKQKCVIEVSEEGTEAAAVTSIGVRLTSLRPENQPVVMRVDRPFLFLIRSIEDQNILFIGRVMNL